MNFARNIRIVTQKDLISAGCLDFTAAVRVCEYALREYANGGVIFPDKVSVIFDEATQDRINCLPAGFVSQKVYGMKWVSVFPQNPIKNNVPNVSAVLLLSELETGFPIAFIEGTMLSNIRTAAMSALAAKYLANKSPEDIGFIGSGEQAKSHFLAMKSMFASLKRCRISSVSSASNQYFISQMKHFCPDVEIIDCGCDYKDAVSYADIIITAISGQEPLLKADYIKYGAFYCHVGGYEDEFAVAKKASKIVCDSWETVKHRTQTISRMYKQGLLKDNDIHADLYEIVIGEKVGRESPSEFIYYNGVGLSFIDVAIGKWAFDRVVTIGLGENILLQDKSIFH